MLKININMFKPKWNISEIVKIMVKVDPAYGYSSVYILAVNIKQDKKGVK